MKTLLIVLFLSVPFFALSQEDSAALAEISAFQQKLNAEFAHKEDSPLTKKDRRKFKKLPFFPVDLSYRVTARFVRTQQALPFQMPTTTARRPIYEQYAEAHFELKGQKFVLPIYQSHDLRQSEKYKTYLFLPFTDATNGNESYAGGRYIGLEIPEGDEIVIDFNQAYNPYCAYNGKYSCPIPPKENHLPIEIRAGVMAPAKH